MPALQIDTPAPSVPVQKFLCFGIRQESASGTAGGDTLKANECFLSDAPPGKKCADRMGDSPPGKEGQRGSAMPKAGNPAKRGLDQPAEAAGKKRGIANVRKNSGSYMQSIYAENSVAGAKNFKKNF